MVYRKDNNKLGLFLFLAESRLEKNFLDLVDKQQELTSFVDNLNQSKYEK